MRLTLIAALPSADTGRESTEDLTGECPISISSLSAGPVSFQDPAETRIRTKGPSRPGLFSLPTIAARPADDRPRRATRMLYDWSIRQGRSA